MPNTPSIGEYKVYIITEDNSDKVFEDLKNSGIDPVLFGLTDEGYETKSINDKKTMNYIIQLRTIIEEQKEYYEGNR